MSLSAVYLTATTSSSGTAGGDTMTSTLLMVGMLVVMFGALYFFMIRPQRKRDKALKAQVEKMAVGDTIVTIGGVVGTIANMQDDNVTIATSVAHTMITFKKSAVNTVVPRQQ